MRWPEFVAELASTPDVVARLIAAHEPDAAGRCVSCTTPGRGTPLVEWPCVLRRLAEAARDYSTRSAGPDSAGAPHSGGQATRQGGAGGEHHTMNRP